MSRPAAVRRSAVALATVVLLTGCSGEPQPSASPSTSPSASPSASPTPTPSVSPPPTPEQEFAREVEELYALVKESVEGTSDLRSASTVLEAFATTVALVRVPPELTDVRQRVVDAAQAAARSYGTAAGITSAMERPSAVRQAVVRLRELEKVIRTLPE